MCQKSENEYISCDIIEHGIDAEIDSINLGGRITKDKITDKIVLLNNYKGQKIDWNKFFEKKAHLINIQKSGQTIPECKGCIYLRKDNWKNEHYISIININNWIKCNAECIYCGRNQHYKNKKEYKIYPLIKELVENKLLRMPVNITIAGGEPTLTRDFDKTINLLIKNNISPVRVLTNGIKYNRYIEKGLNLGLVNILVSVDSGTEQTYKYIKRTNKFKDVWKNLKKYASKQKKESLVKTKYIIIPGVNDNKREISLFMNKNRDNSIKYTEIDIETFWYYRYCNNNALLQRMYELYLYAKEQGEKDNIVANTIDRMQLAQEKLITRSESVHTNPHFER